MDSFKNFLKLGGVQFPNPDSQAPVVSSAAVPTSARSTRPAAAPPPASAPASAEAKRKSRSRSLSPGKGRARPARSRSRSPRPEPPAATAAHSTDLGGEPTYYLEDVLASAVAPTAARSSAPTGEGFRDLFNYSSYLPPNERKSTARTGAGGGSTNRGRGRGRGRSNADTGANGGGMFGGSRNDSSSSSSSSSARPSTDIFASLPASVLDPPPLLFPTKTEEERVALRRFMKLVAGLTKIPESKLMTDPAHEERIRQLRIRSQTGANEERDFVLRLTNQAVTSSLQQADVAGLAAGAGDGLTQRDIYIEPNINAALETAYEDLRNFTNTKLEVMTFMTHDSLRVNFARMVANNLSIVDGLRPQQYFERGHMGLIREEKQALIQFFKITLAKLERSGDSFVPLYSPLLTQMPRLPAWGLMQSSAQNALQRAF